LENGERSFFGSVTIGMPQAPNRRPTLLLKPRTRVRATLLQFSCIQTSVTVHHCAHAFPARTLILVKSRVIPKWLQSTPSLGSRCPNRSDLVMVPSMSEMTCKKGFRV
jgi:hypothetical protein